MKEKKRSESLWLPSCCRFKRMALSVICAFGMSVPFMAADMVYDDEKTPAFPGAEGWGRYVTGGRGGVVYHVTNLNDSGPGSLRAAVEASGKRTVVFDVSGTIFLKNGLSIKYPDITIAGQTAPGDGICVADYNFDIQAPNVIIRYMRFRPGNLMALNGIGEPDALEAKDGRNIIIDHCSLSWSVDECCSVYGNRFTTVQWCLIAQSLRHAGHSKDAHGYGAMMGGEGASYHHNLLVHHDSRHPRLGEREATGARDTTDFRCNVMYNWGGQGCYGAENMNANIVNNYYKPGPATSARGSGIEQRICGVAVNETQGHPMYHVWARLFVDGNVNSKYSRVTANNWSTGIWQQIDSKYRSNASAYNLDQERMRLAEPMKYYYVTTHSAEDTYDRVLAYAGASLSRDGLDELMVSDTRNGVATYTGNGDGNLPGIIDTPEDNRPKDAPANWSPWPLLAAGEAQPDTDGDGIPDAWERQHGLDPDNAADGNYRNDEGYTNLEIYMNSLVAHITEAQNEGGVADGYRETRREIAPEYELSVATRNGSDWTFEGDFSLGNDRNGGFGTSGELIRIPQDALTTITLPDDVEVTAVRFAGKGHYAGDRYGDAMLTEMAGRGYEGGEYSLPKGGEGEFTVDLDSPVRDALTFRFSGNAATCKITLYTQGRSGIAAVEADAPAGQGISGVDDNGWYNLQGIRIPEPQERGLYIHNRRLVLK